MTSLTRSVLQTRPLQVKAEVIPLWKSISTLNFHSPPAFSVVLTPAKCLWFMNIEQCFCVMRLSLRLSAIKVLLELELE